MLSGLPAIYGIDPYSSEATPSHQLGVIGYAEDGRRFRYVKNNATNAMVAGELQQAEAEDTGEQSLAVAAAAVGSKTVTTTDTVTVTANEYADGYLIGTAEGGTGNGIAYKIKSHPAATSAVVTFTLYEPLKVAFNTSTQIDVMKNVYDGVIQNPTSASGAIAGVAMTAVPASYYAWVQTGGAGVVKADAGGAITVGQQIVASNQTAGCCENGADATDAQALIGQAMTGIASAEFGMAMLNIA